MEGLIGQVAKYVGHKHTWMLDGHDLRVVAVIKRPGGDPDAGTVCHTNEALADTGGVDPERDIIEVVAWLGDPYDRWGFVPSDVKLADLNGLRDER